MERTGHGESACGSHVVWNVTLAVLELPRHYTLEVKALHDASTDL